MGAFPRQVNGALVDYYAKGRTNRLAPMPIYSTSALTAFCAATCRPTFPRVFVVLTVAIPQTTPQIGAVRAGLAIDGRM
jgi:hypothetical protein